MKPVAFLDLDDTLFFSTSKKTPAMQTVGALSNTGSAGAWLGAAQERLLSWLQSSTDIVVTTGRSVDATRRVTLPLHGWKICCYGGVILQPDDSICTQWEQHIASQFKDGLAELEELLTIIMQAASQHNIDIRGRIVPIGQHAGYLCFKHNQRNVPELHSLLPTLDEHQRSGWLVHVNGNNISLLPPPVRKGHAVRWLQETHFADRLSIGIGDSLSDVDYFASCDLAMQPTSSQAFSILQTRFQDVLW